MKASVLNVSSVAQQCTDSLIETNGRESAMPKLARDTKAILISSILLVASVLWCFDGLSIANSDFIFVPSGDVAYGFRSFAGSLEWVQNAGWQRNPYYPAWSVPWWMIISIKCAALFYFGWRSTSQSPPQSVDVLSSVQFNRPGF